MSDFVKKSDPEFAAQLSTFSGKLPDYATVLGIPGATLTAVADDSLLMTALVPAVEASKTYSQGWTSFKDLARDGGEASLPPYPSAVNTGALPPNVVPGIEKRFRDLVRTIKANPAYTVGMGEDLGIEVEESHPELGVPELKLSVAGGNIAIGFKKGAAQGIRLYSKRGSETTATLLAVVTRSPFTDTRPNLVEDVAEKREYYAYYIVNDVQVGLKGATVSISV